MVRGVRIHFVDLGLHVPVYPPDICYEVAANEPELAWFVGGTSKSKPTKGSLLQQTTSAVSPGPCTVFSNPF